MKIKFNKTYFALLLITLFSLAIRLYRIGVNVPPLYADEAGQYELWVWLNTPHPISISNLFNTFYNYIFTYTWFLGLTVLGVRLPAAIYGSLIPAAIYFLTSKIKLKRELGMVPIFAALLAAVIPWSFMISRIGHTHIPLLVIITCLSAGFFLKENKLKYCLLSLFFFILGAIYYPTLIVIAPFYLIMLWYQLKKLKTITFPKVIGLLTGVGIILFLLFLSKYQGFSLNSRGLDLAIWNDVNVTAESNLYRGIARQTLPDITSLFQNPELLNKFFYNFPVAVLNQLSENYLSFFSLEWLFLKGDPVLRHSTAQVGMFYPLLLPFMIYGAWLFFNRANTKSKWLFAIWILASPIPAAITNDGAGYLLRAITMLPFLTYFCALGIVGLKNQILKIKNQKLIKLYLICLIGIGLYSIYYFLFGYFHVYPTLAAKSYEFGFKELADFQMSHRGGKMLVIWQGYFPDTYFRFWQQTPVEKYVSEPQQEFNFNESIFYQTNDDLYFGWPKRASDLEAFLETDPVDWLVFPGNYLVKYPEYKLIVGDELESIKYQDDNVAFEIFTIK